MAKKVVASLQKGGGKEHTKVVKMVKSDKTGSYTFKEEIVHNDKVKDWFAPQRRTSFLSWMKKPKRIWTKAWIKRSKVS